MSQDAGSAKGTHKGHPVTSVDDQSLSNLENTDKVVILFGGTFDPIHHGHLRMALEAQWRMQAQAVWFIPNADPPHKTGTRASGAQRAAMIELAIASSDQTPKTTFSIEHYELERGDDQPSYTYQTIQALKERYPHYRFVWLVGQDSFNTFDQWHQWRLLLDSMNWLIVKRPDYAAQYSSDLNEEYAKRSINLPDFGTSWHQEYGNILTIDTTMMDISSTSIRSIASQGLPCDYLTPIAVSRYIMAHRLYQSASEPEVRCAD